MLHTPYITEKRKLFFSYSNPFDSTVPQYQKSLKECIPDMSMGREDITNFRRYFVMFYLFIMLVHCEKKLPVKTVASLPHSTWIFYERFKVCVIWIVLSQALIVTLGRIFPAGIFLLKFNNRNTRKRCEICSKLTIKLFCKQWRRSSLFIVNFEHISHLFLMFLLLTLNISVIES